MTTTDLQVRQPPTARNPWTPAVHTFGILAALDALAALWAELDQRTDLRNWLLVAGFLLITLAYLALGNEDRHPA